jgi:hypothetical protein
VVPKLLEEMPLRPQNLLKPVEAEVEAVVVVLLLSLRLEEKVATLS